MWEAGHGVAMSLLAPAGSNACKYPNPEDASTLRMEMWKRGMGSMVCFPEENSKPTPVVLPSCPKTLSAQGKAAGRGQEAGCLPLQQPELL